MTSLPLEELGSEPPLIYRAPLRSLGLGVDHSSAVTHCRHRGVLGLGWGLDSPPVSLEDAFARVRDVYSPRAAATIRRFSRAPSGSLIWSRDLNGRYLLGSLSGEWGYDDSPAAKAVDVHHVRPVAWATRTLLGEEVPGAVVRAWAGLGSSFSQIHSYTARLLSVRLYDELQGRTPELLRVSPEQVLRELLDPYDVEDLVYTFLQAQRDYIVLPKSRRTNTLAYEYLLISREHGHAAIVQVKTGASTVDLELLARSAGEDVHAFAYSTTGSYAGEGSGVEIIDESQLLEFVRAEPRFLPPRVRRWFEYLSE